MRPHRKTNQLENRPILKTHFWPESSETTEDHEIADSSDENSPFTYQDDIDPVEMAGFSIRRT